MNIKFSVKEVHDGFVVSRKNGLYEQHSHVATEDGVELLLRLIRKNQLPESEYLRQSAKRLLTPREYSELHFKIRKGCRYRFDNKYDEAEKRSLC